MSHHSPTTLTVAFGLGGILIGAACTADWLSDAATWEMFWRPDINARIVTALGGETGNSGNYLRLSTFSVALRFCGLTLSALIAGILIGGRTSAAQLTAQLMTRLGIIGTVSGFVWSIPLLTDDRIAQATVPQMVMLLVGAVICSLLLAILDSLLRSGTSGVKPAWALMLLLTVVWTGISFQLNERLYANLLIPHGDSAMYEEHLWNVWHGKGFRSYLDQGLFLGEHIQVIHLLLLPAHMIWPSHLTLELAESVALGSCTIPLFLIVLRRTHDAWAACLIAISWLFFFPMHFLDIAIDQKTFRPVCLGLPFLFWMIYSAETGRYRSAWIFLLLALSAKEDMALIAAPVGVVLALSTCRGGVDLRPLRNWGIAVASVSVGWLLLAVLVVIPAFRSGEVVHYSRYFGELGSTPDELVRTAVQNPSAVLSRIFSFRTLFYTVVFLAPVAFVAVRSPLRLAAGSFTFFMLSLVQLGNGADGEGLPPVPYHHFHAPLLPVLFWSVVGGVPGPGTSPGRLLKWLTATPRSTALLVLCCCVTTGSVGSPLLCGMSYWSDDSFLGRHTLYFPRDDVAAEHRLIQRAEMADRIVDQIPLTSRVASTDFIHTRLTHCQRSYDYSDYKRVVNEEGKRVPADCQYIVIDTGHRYSAIRNASEVPELTESDDWELLPDTTDGWFLVLRRKIR